MRLAAVIALPTRSRFELSEHGKKRLFERAVPAWVAKAAWEKGEPISAAHARGELVVRMLTHYSGRPLHCLFSVKPEVVSMITAIRPDTRPWQWADGYRKRVCFCLPEEWDD